MRSDKQARATTRLSSVRSLLERQSGRHFLHSGGSAETHECSRRKRVGWAGDHRALAGDGFVTDRRRLIRSHRTSGYESEVLSRYQAENSQKYSFLYLLLYVVAYGLMPP